MKTYYRVSAMETALVVREADQWDAAENTETDVHH